MLQRAAVRLDFFSKFRRNGGILRGRGQKEDGGSANYLRRSRMEASTAYMKGDRKNALL